MKGNELYNKEWAEKTHNYIAKNDKDGKKFLSAFSSYMLESSVRTNHAYVCCADNLCKYANKGAKDLTLTDYTMYMSSHREKSSTFKIQTYSALKKYSNFLYASHICADNPMQFVGRPKAIESDETRKKREAGFLTKEEIQEMLFSVVDLNNDWFFMHRDDFIIRLLLSTGMRSNALLKLNVEDIDFKAHKIVTIDKGSKVQEYSLNSEMMNRAKEWLEVREITMRQISGDHSGGALFTVKRTGERLGYVGLSELVKKYSGAIGKEVSPHKLRASYGTQIYEATHDIYCVQMAMGHSSPKTSEMYVRGQKNEARQKASDIMAQILSQI